MYGSTLDPLQYFKSQRFDHLAKFCRNNVIGGHCGSDNHSHIECREKKRCVYCTSYNAKFNTQFEFEHDLKDRKCSMHEKELANLRNRINRSYSV